MRKHNKLWVPAILTLAAVSALPGCSTPNAQGAVAGRPHREDDQARPDGGCGPER
ncbi:hypothetical protein LJK88_41285 [Paenibacillus sp. P26]|nr:hypothetical protein LJK88_41285 [Paenibacillus sp. P26]